MYKYMYIIPESKKMCNQILSYFNKYNKILRIV